MSPHADIAGVIARRGEQRGSLGGVLAPVLFRLLPELGKTLAVRPFRLGVSAALLGPRRGEPGVARRICLRFLGKTRSLVFGELLAVGIGKAHLRGFRQAAGDTLCGKTLRQRALALHILAVKLTVGALISAADALERVLRVPLGRLCGGIGGGFVFGKRVSVPVAIVALHDFAVRWAAFGGVPAAPVSFPPVSPLSAGALLQPVPVRFFFFLRHSSALLPGGVFVPKFSSRTAFIFSSPYRI